MIVHHPELVGQIANLGDIGDKNVFTLTKIAIKIDIRDETFLDRLFWLLNEMRGFTFEYYLILLAHIFLNTNRCKTLNRHNKLSNITQFLKPLYTILFLYKDYVTKCGLEMALSSKTLESFNMLHNKEISEAIKHFSSHLLSSKLPEQKL